MNELAEIAGESREDRFKRYLDWGYEDVRPRPSMLFTIATCVLATVPGGMLGTVRKDAPANVEQYIAWAVGRARELFRAGYYPNIYAKEPRVRV
jgi:hypothetical protein